VRGLFTLALELHMTVAQLTANMTMREYAQWSAYFEDKALERKRAENRAKGIVDFTDPQAASQLIGLVRNGGKP
jgi:dihydrodipicolinate reductase